MNKDHIISTILLREELKKMSRLARLLRAPLRTLPFYVLAAAGHVHPYKLRFKTLWGTTMTSYLPEGNTFYYYGYCEANLTNFFLRYLQPGMTCVDVGAHVGFYSMLFAELTGTEGAVHSFEPTPWTYRLLTENTKQYPQVVAHNLALGSEDATLTFADYGPGYGAYNSAHKSGAPAMKSTPTQTSVEATSLTKFCAGVNLKPDIIKLDAEGFEFEILEGASVLLSPGGARPLISIEVAGGGEWSVNRNQSFALLSEAGYHVFEITTDGHLTPHTLLDSYEYDNLLWIPEERLSTCEHLFV